MVNFSQEEQGQTMAALNQARYGYLLTLQAVHMSLLCAAGCYLTETAVVLFGLRSGTYRAVWAYR